MRLDDPRVRAFLATKEVAILATVQADDEMECLAPGPLVGVEPALPQIFGLAEPLAHPTR
jgi:hypothetical protein